MPRTQRRPSVGRSLTHYWKIHLALTLGVTVTSAILTGALLVGDSVRGSLRDLTLERLGKIEFSLSSAGFFRDSLATELQSLEDVEIAPSVILQGSVLHANSNRRTSNVQILGIDSRFLALFPESFSGPLLDVKRRPAQRVQTSVAINESLQEDLKAEVGDSILLSFDKKAAINPEFILGSRDTADLQQTLRLTIARITPNRSLGRFSLSPHQATPYNIYLPLEVVQDALSQQGKANTLLVSGAVGGNSVATLEENLHRVAALDDFGLRWRSGTLDAVLESRDMLISPALEQGIWRAAADLGITPRPVLTYLANRIQSEKAGIPYSTVSAIALEGDGLPDRLRLVSGETAQKIGADEILLNQWAAQDLNAAVGDTIALTYYVADWQENLTIRTTSLQLRGIVSMAGLAIDETLTPEISGIHDATDMASWDPPIPIDLGQIRKQDEEYWDEYRAAPKAFLSYETGVELWKNRFGRLTSVRFSEDESSREEIEAALLRTLNPELIGSFRASKDEGLRAATGSTDFGMLFIGFSLFLIVSAVLIVALLFRLGLENRAREIGLLLSVGFPARKVRKVFLVEGVLIAVTGSLFGLALAWAYAGLLIAGLKTIWVAAIGSSFLTLHVAPITLIIGFIASLVAIIASLFITFHSLAELPATSLLTGTTEKPGTQGSKWARAIFCLSLGSAVLLLLSSLFIASESSPVLFFGLGAALLVSGLSMFSIWLRRERPSSIAAGGFLPTTHLAVRNCARNPGRSLLSAALVASACFVIVAVGANRSQAGTEVLKKDSGAGGFTVRAKSTVPMVRDLNSSEALLDLGFADADIRILEQAKFYRYRLRPGEDISCKNLYQPSEPILLGVPEQQIARGGFRFHALVRETETPWELLQDDLGPNVVPAFGDANSVMWILHLALGDDLVMKNEYGEEIRLRLVGLLARSIFQSELLISDENFEKHFPSLSGYSYFLIQMPSDQTGEITTVLEKTLSRYGFDTTTTPQLLAGFFAVENTYLSTFQSLGGLGLLLGTIGLGIILVRNTIERRGELATLQAFGFSTKKLSFLLLQENCFLLGFGIALGTVSALVAVAPHLLSKSDSVPWGSLFITLLSILTFGTLTGFLSLRIALRTPLLCALRQE